MNEIIYTRKELYDLVWSIPITGLAKKHLLTYNELKKICIRMNIPLPKVGHWEKIRAGKPVEVFELSSDDSGEQEITLAFVKEGEQNPEKSLSTEKLLELEIERELGELLVVPDRLNNPDKLVLAAKESLTRKSEYGLDKGLKYTYANEINIRVAPDNVGRALRFMDTFIKCTRKRNHQIIQEHRDTFILVGEEKMKINFREKLKRTLVPGTHWNTSEYSPTGILTFNVQIWFTNVEWKDGKQPLEEQIARIIAKLERRSAELKEESLQREKERKIRDEQEQIKRDLLKQKENELSAFKHLLNDAKRWKETEILREYLNHLESISSDKPDSKWLLWARKKADWYDPTTVSADELLPEINNSGLNFD